MIVLRYALPIIFFALSGSCWAQEQAGGSKAEVALKQMHQHLAEAAELEFVTQFHVVDKVLGKNEKGSVEYKIRKPNLLRVTAKLPTGKIVAVSDGKTLTIHQPGKRLYEEFAAKDSVVGSIYLAAGLLGAQTRLVDFFWTVDFLSVGGYGKVGQLEPKTIGSKTCDGFEVERGNEVWKVWLERSAERLPCYVISKTTGGSAFVTQTNALRWNPKPNFSKDTFNFIVPAGHRKRN